MTDQLALYAAVYSSTSDALKDLQAVEELHRGDVIGSFDAAVIDKEDGKPHIVKRMDRPGIRALPEAFGGGKLPRKDLKEAAEELSAGQAGLIVVGKPTVEKAVENAIAGADKVVKRVVDATADEIADELASALQS